MKKFIISLLQKRAKVVLDKFKPRVVAITGSVGKTSAKQAIALVLSTKYKIRTAEKNFNNEIGVPLTILGMKSPGRNPFGWLTLFWKSYFIKTYPEMLILEYGADHPGDIKNLCDLASPDVAIITGISPVHAEFFKDIDHLADEKSEIIKRLPDNGVAILNGDDKRVLTMQTLYQSFMTYGTKETDIQADEIIEICPIIMLNAKDTNEIDKTHLYDYYFSWREQGSAISLGYAHSIIILTNPMLNTIKIL